MANGLVYYKEHRAYELETTALHYTLSLSHITMWLNQNVSKYLIRLFILTGTCFQFTSNISLSDGYVLKAFTYRLSCTEILHWVQVPSAVLKVA